jgi:outer membrane protein
MKKSWYRKSTAVIAGLIYLFIFTLPAGAFEVGARGSYWFPSLKATMKAGGSGTEVNLKDDLGIGDSNTYSVEAFAGLGNHHLSLSYTPLDYSASTNIQKPINFNNKTYTAGSSVNTDLHLKMLDAEYQYDLLNFENILAGFSINLLGKIKYLDGEAKMNSTLTGEQKQTFAIPIPMVGAGAHIGLIAKILEARAKVAGIGYSGNYFVDALADIAFTPFPFTRLSAGYRYMKIKIDNVSDTYGDMDFYGPYLGLTVAW